VPTPNGLTRQSESTTEAVTDGLNNSITHNMQYKGAHFWAKKNCKVGQQRKSFLTTQGGLRYPRAG